MKKQGKSKEYLLVLVGLVLLERIGRYFLIQHDSQLNTKIIYGQVDYPYWFGLIIGIILMWLIRLICCPKTNPTTKGWLGWALPLIVLGSVMNLIDWAMFGGVVDYLDLNWLSFNLADIYIGAGLALLGRIIVLAK